ncbi:hypothetical protein KIF24_09595 [Micromonospora sp. Llam7]|uniref:hypothetical protein n=1 Tax=Micromonospora tarapacensis TaxID=2835305 RepID=UPI001C83DE5E|nr:hypothetical protein [Micromonospora tarapacensis]MBX7266246.1 hypothetical protein [Micromonospora tarapacensis]
MHFVKMFVTSAIGVRIHDADPSQDPSHAATDAQSWMQSVALASRLDEDGFVGPRAVCRGPARTPDRW